MISQTYFGILIKLLFLVLSLLYTENIFGQEIVLDNSRIAIKTGSSRELARHFLNTVEVKLDGDSRTYSKTQAEFVLKDFFRKNPPSSFEYVHKGSSREGLMYAIGKYDGQTGSFRVYILIKEADTGFWIDTIDFSRED
jgi:hypothetical protein